MKKPHTLACSIAIAMAMACAAFAQTGGGMGGSDRDQDRGAGGAVTAGSGQRPGGQQFDRNAEERCVKHLISCNNFEIQLAELAQQKVQDPQLKQFAQQMVQDHRQTLQQLQPIAKAMNVDTGSQQQLMPAHQAMLDGFREKSGRVFEIGYIAHQVGDHHMEIVASQLLAREVQNPQLRQFFTQQTPQLQQHLTLINKIAEANGADTARTASERMGPGGTTGSDRSGTGTGGAGDR